MYEYLIEKTLIFSRSLNIGLFYLREKGGNGTMAKKDTNTFSVIKLQKLIEAHSKNKVGDYVTYQELYEGKHEIAKRQAKDTNKPNNKLSNDYFGQIIDTTVGYFLGNPIILNYVAYTGDNKETVGALDVIDKEDTTIYDCLNDILIDNDKDDLFMEWGKEAMIKGLSHLLIYQNEESKTKIMRVSPENIILVYKNSSTKEILYAIRVYESLDDEGEIKKFAEVYSETDIEYFESVKTTTKGSKNAVTYRFVEKRAHIYNQIPIVTLYNNEEVMSDLEKIKSLVDDYDKVLSDVSNEFEVFRNAYLLIKNMILNEKSLGKLKTEGILEVSDDGDAKFITKQIQTDALENHLTRLEKNIYKFAQVPDLSDENFAGNLSGVAIRFKLFGLETKCIIKERKMEKAIRQLVRVLSQPIRVITNKALDIVNLDIDFTRNIPNNITEIVDTVTKLDGKVDKETLLALLPFIDNPKDVLEKIKADMEAEKEIADPYSDVNVKKDSNILFPNLNAEEGI